MQRSSRPYLPRPVRRGGSSNIVDADSFLEILKNDPVTEFPRNRNVRRGKRTLKFLTITIKIVL